MDIPVGTHFTQLISGFWKSSETVEFLAIYKGPTVDGRNPAPPGMYKTL